VFEFSFAPLRETPLRFSFISRKGAKSIREAQRKTFGCSKKSGAMLGFHDSNIRG
jgi:hypothetical protein